MKLTKYAEGSVRELWAVAFPLMLSSLSLLFMIFCDRLFLAHFQEEAMSASVTAGTAAWAVLGSTLILASMAEVFVAQFNGAKHFEGLGAPVWQMIWFSLLSSLWFLPLALWGGPLFFKERVLGNLESTFFQWLMVFGFAWPLQGALAAFYVGRGKTAMIMTLAIVANLVNIFLDWLLIFGVCDLIPPMGIKGAAIATSLGNLFQVCVLGACFLHSKNRRSFGSSRYQFRWELFRKSLRVGVPPSMLFFFEMVGWAIFYVQIRDLGPSHIFIAGVGQTVTILFFFAAEGIGRGASAVSGNFIGAGRPELVFRVFRSGLKLHLGFFFFASLFFVIYPQFFIGMFTTETFRLLTEGASFSGPFLSGPLLGTLKLTINLCLFYLLFEGIRWLTSGILTAAGDTIFLLIVGLLAVPLFLLLPTYILIKRMHAGVSVAFAVSIGYAFMVSTIYLWRFFGRRWQRIRLIGEV